MRIHVILLILPVLVSCSDVVSVFQEPDKIAFQCEDKARLNTAKDVLTRRFNELPQSIFSSVKSEIKGNVIEMSIFGGLPSIETINDVVLVPGKVYFRAESGAIIVSSKDVEDASSGIDQQSNKPAVFVTMNQKGEHRLRDWTSKNIGQLMMVVYDDTIVSKARIAGVLEKRFMITEIDDTQLARRIALYLRTGFLPTKVTLVDKTNSAGRPGAT